MGNVVKVDFRRKGFEALNEDNQARIKGLAAGLLSDDWPALYGALKPERRKMLDNYIADLLQQQRREARTT